MAGSFLLSSAYLPPVEYFAVLNKADNVQIEREENYLKQTYRNRCNIITASGLMSLSVPVYLGSFHKTPVKEIRIDYSRRWQQIHIGAIRSSYAASPYFIFYFNEIEKIIMSKHNFLLDLNMELLTTLMKMMNIKSEIIYTTDFIPVKSLTNDFRYSITPKKTSAYNPKNYMHVFNFEGIDKAKLSIIDLLFNKGPDSSGLL